MHGYLTCLAVHGLAGWSRAVRRDNPQPANRTNMSGSTLSLTLTSSPSHKVDIVTALFSQRYRCESCSNGIATWKIDRDMFTNQLRRVLREQLANKNRNFEEEPCPSFALGNSRWLISTSE